ncbi:hypothetical protein TCAL_01265 [Tigriopus californicus]|uniref:Copper transport protein n=1 Tax=Tigriopus californicus TaxID=6832 RepID=A0A553PB93_TIGCA|nr:high affinity copper uptake protein 1-like [Tigriopus californicus]TRY74947.1 hypothetical protein TCAL_01265 [Tigriopus californicus]|eukprot:TCALIF_01265-PA protein Name:"Similar to SLC31A1 High affinity copper uptake protein 1 (Homo sapiens)" AED:0.02 eAED:0.02 QI:0/-1/0/1/-1/1/1/0/214
MDHSHHVNDAPQNPQLPPANPHMDHSSHTDHSMPVEMDHSMMMMKMYFHGGYEEVILFDFWRISTIWGLLGSMVAVFILSVAYEGIKLLREYLFRKFMQPAGSYNALSPAPTHQSNPMGEAASTSSVEQVESPAPQMNPESIAIRTIETRMWSQGHLILTFLHMIQVTLAYILMLVFMTYNSWLCLAVVLGFTTGYFLFGWRKMVVFDEPDHCH